MLKFVNRLQLLSILQVLSIRTMSTAMRKAEFLPLKYKYEALEPYISKQIMELHHTKHYKTYVDNYNKALNSFQNAIKSDDLQEQLRLQPILKFNGGGVINHAIFWESMAPPANGGGEPPSGPLASAIDNQFGTFDNFKQKFNTALLGIQGSGWGWLVKMDKTLEIQTTANQDPITQGTVIMGVDAWEHAYYLQYENQKAKYFDSIWHVIDWKAAGKRYESA